MLCVCTTVPSIANRTTVTVLQHPREFRHPLGTARLLRLGLQNIHVQVCWQLQHPPRLQADCGVLYPHPSARDLATLPHDTQPRHLVVLDGTWHGARKLHQANPWLATLPHYTITPDGIDRYRIRREPQPHCTSTVEAVVHALRVLEPDTAGFDDLLAAFTTMISRQIDAMGPRDPRLRRRLLRTRRRRGAVPMAWRAQRDGVVLIYAEYHPEPLPDGRRDLLLWTAHHPASGRTMSTFIQPRTNLPPPGILDHMGFTAADLQGGVSVEALQQAWDTFLPPQPRIVAWTQATLDISQRHLTVGAPHDLLKASYCNHTRARAGHIETALQRHGLLPSPMACPGRAGIRLAAARALWEWLLVDSHDGADSVVKVAAAAQQGF